MIDVLPPPGPGPLDRDCISAGLVLLRHVLADPASSTAPWDAVRDFYTAVAPRLEANDAEDSGLEWASLLRWGQVHDGAALTGRIADALMDGSSDTLGEDAVLGLMELSDRLSAADSGAPPPPVPSGDGPDVVVEGPDGTCVILAANSVTPGADWSAEIGNDVTVAVDESLSEVLTDLMSGWSPTAASGRPHWVRWPPGVSVNGRLAAATITLRLLGRISGLGDSDLFVAGDLDRGKFVPLDDVTLERLIAATTRTGRNLLVPGPHGWLLRSARGGPMTRNEAPLTVDGAAAIVWGDAWGAWKREQHASELAASGWSVLVWQRPPDSQPIPDCNVHQVGVLKRHLIASERGTVAALGGTSGSGRSAIVRRLAADLATRKKPWSVQVVRGPRGELPDKRAATAAGRHALGMLEHLHERRLLVYEDVQPMRRGAVDEMLHHVARELRGTDVLGVLEYDENSREDWDTETVFVVTGVVRGPARYRFVTDLAAEPGMDPVPARVALTRDRGISLRDLTLLMAGTSDPAAELVNYFSELANDEQAAVLRAAAASLVSADTTEADLEFLDDQGRRVLGVVVGRGTSTLRLPESVSRTLLDLHRQARNTTAAATISTLGGVLNDLIAELLRPRLEALLRDADRGLVELLLGARLCHGALCRDLLGYADREGLLSDWTAVAPTMAVARLLDMAEMMPARAPGRCAATLVRRLQQELIGQSPAELLAIGHHVESVAAVLDAETMDAFLRWFAQVVDFTVERQTGRPDERFALLVLTNRFDCDNDVQSMLMMRALDVLAGLSPDDVDDYRLVRRVDQFYRRMSRRVDADARRFPIEAEPAVETLLGREPDRSHTVDLLIEAMALRLQFGADWDVDLPKYQPFLSSAMGHANAVDLTRALQEVRNHRPQFGTWLLSRWEGFPGQVRAVLRRSSATDAANLLSAVLRSNNLIAGTVLHGGDIRALAVQLADRGATPNEAQTVVRDAKGIGRLLSVTREIDELFHVSGEQFSTVLAEHLGRERIEILLELDPRTSVRYHLIRGVWDAEASYRDQLLDSVADVVVRAVEDGRKHWGPEIGLRVAADPELGSQILATLRERIPASAVLAGMGSATTAHGRAMFHRFGRLLHPEIPSQFLLSWDVSSFSERLSSPTPAAALEVCLEAARTLTSADLPDAGPLIVEETGGAQTWAGRLAFGGRADGFADGLARLNRIDPVAAGAVVDDLAGRPSRFLIADEPVGALVGRLRGAFLAGPSAIAAVLNAVHRTRPEVASQLLAAVAEDKHAMHVFRFEMQFIQDPHVLWRAARALAQCGVTRHAENTAWIEEVHESRIKVLHRFYSPRALVSMVKTHSTWDKGWGTEAIKRIRLAEVVRRVRTTPRDLPQAVELTRVLAALEHRGEATEVLQAVTAHDLRQVAAHHGLDVVCQILDLANELRPDDAQRVALALQDAIDRHVRTPSIMDERVHWLQVARACAAVADLGPLPLVDEPLFAPNVVFGPELAWAAVGLGRQGWGNNALDRVADRLRDRPPMSASGQACLLAATMNGWSPDLRSQSVNWDVSAAPFWILRNLVQQSANDRLTARLLRAASSVISSRASSDILRADWDASRLRLVLDTPVSQADAAMRTIHRSSRRPGRR